mmetsp:Transcript_14153/g.34037  ORF Transcript_14153/g.34037 Transcript_14153/m.34037 type:complete len:233 (+) Transcript_14153:607-1305(+)
MLFCVTPPPPPFSTRTYSTRPHEYSSRSLPYFINRSAPLLPSLLPAPGNTELGMFEVKCARWLPIDAGTATPCESLALPSTKMPPHAPVTKSSATIAVWLSARNVMGRSGWPTAISCAPGMMMMDGSAFAPPQLSTPHSTASWLVQLGRTWMTVPSSMDRKNPGMMTTVEMTVMTLRLVHLTGSLYTPPAKVQSRLGGGGLGGDVASTGGEEPPGCAETIITIPPPPPLPLP